MFVQTMLTQLIGIGLMELGIYLRVRMTTKKNEDEEAKNKYYTLVILFL